MNQGGYSSRYMAYCRELKVPPLVQLIEDERFRNRHGYDPFLVWIRSQWFKWEMDHPERKGKPRTPTDYRSFTLWLKRNVM